MAPPGTGTPSCRRCEGQDPISQTLGGGLLQPGHCPCSPCTAVSPHRWVNRGTEAQPSSPGLQGPGAGQAWQGAPSSFPAGAAARSPARWPAGGDRPGWWPGGAAGGAAGRGWPCRKPEAGPPPREPLSRPGSDQWAVIIPRRARSRRGGSGSWQGAAGGGAPHVTLMDSSGGRCARGLLGSVVLQHASPLRPACAPWRPPSWRCTLRGGVGGHPRLSPGGPSLGGVWHCWRQVYPFATHEPARARSRVGTGRVSPTLRSRVSTRVPAPPSAPPDTLQPPHWRG